ncbi:MAG: lysophospholipase [Phenylobacterium sp. RIFCSPHIGHO2_01_FULL_69_31]|jgi:acylglycerol lipase|uniref:alpha/beta fold hydrolase n=2 Tax=unclassified Phenylobacterium TaxID=2640670 RepID=UPI0008BD8117|nr:alpha/beta fold hydrolase [Phenylobacterium sp. RIFCSPHIGHO2_01_FULL_69_31]OHB28893.1 MAG: lysophospholipase [Phenylobacterium sp. RIFCSPHIGHO2_01_FULL_69_31]
MKRLALVFLLLTLSACAPMLVQQAGTPPAGFQGPRIEADAVVSFDGARLGLSAWEATGEPWAVVVAAHGMNDYANAFHFAAEAWAKDGVTTYAYDQRGFGRSPGRGIWAGEDLMVEDLRTVTALARARHPNAIVTVVGESMGGSVAAAAFASDRPPAADRLVLLAPGVWGFKAQPLPNKTLLWLAANFTASKVYTPPRWVTDRIYPTDNREELIAMGRDRLMIWGARSDTLYGLVRLMDRAAKAVGDDHVPTFYLYGANDQIIPKNAAFKAVKRLHPSDRSAYYAAGHHLLTRDKQRAVVIADVLSFIRDPQAPLPSAAPPIPGAASRNNDPADASRRAAGL